MRFTNIQMQVLGQPHGELLVEQRPRGFSVGWLIGCPMLLMIHGVACTAHITLKLGVSRIGSPIRESSRIWYWSKSA